MRVFVLFCFLTHVVYGLPLQEETKEYVEPEYLDSLLAQGRFEEFSRLMGIPDPKLSMPKAVGDRGDPSFNKELFQGDILLSPREMEQARQGLNFTRHPGNRWPNRIVHYAIASNYTPTQRDYIARNISRWNSDVGKCVKFVPRGNEKDYAFFFPGRGCYANLGKVGGQQPISIMYEGCSRQGTIHHEMKHTIGFIHEQSRPDRDEYIEILWQNIPPSWWSQYGKYSKADIVILFPYDYYSIMHYGRFAPETGKEAFKVLKNGIDLNEIGQRRAFTETDKKKILKLYECKS